MERQGTDLDLSRVADIGILLFAFRYLHMFATIRSSVGG